MWRVAPAKEIGVMSAAATSSSHHVLVYTQVSDLMSGLLSIGTRLFDCVAHPPRSAVQDATQP